MTGVKNVAFRQAARALKAYLAKYGFYSGGSDTRPPK